MAFARNVVQAFQGRLTQARLRDIQDWSTNWGSVGYVTTAYAYDDLGNRLSASDRGGDNVTYAHDLANRMTAFDAGTNHAQGYDLAGNLTRAVQNDEEYTEYDYAYDYLNRVTAIIRTRMVSACSPAASGPIHRHLVHRSDGDYFKLPRFGRISSF